jgi:hypothetical protein
VRARARSAARARAAVAVRRTAPGLAKRI